MGNSIHFQPMNGCSCESVEDLEKMSRPEGDSNPNLHIYAECSNHLSYQGQTFVLIAITYLALVGELRGWLLVGELWGVSWWVSNRVTIGGQLCYGYWWAAMGVAIGGQAMGVYWWASYVGKLWGVYWWAAIGGQAMGVDIGGQLWGWLLMGKLWGGYWWASYGVYIGGQLWGGYWWASYGVDIVLLYKSQEALWNVHAMNKSRTHSANALWSRD